MSFKIAIGYPPLEAKEGVPLLSQNRQFQFFNAPTYIYPMVPAYAASLAQENDYDVVWLDGIAEKLSYVEWLAQLKKEKPDLLMIETKAPVIGRHWKIIKSLKKKFPKIKIALVGDHVTYKPEESMKVCPVDFILTGGDYDFVLIDLANHLTKNKPIPKGVWYRTKDGFKSTGKADLKHNIDDLPFIDRDLTKWKLYAYENGNYKYTED